MELPLIIEELESINGVSNIHHVHVWGMSEKDFHFECHADLDEDLSVSKTSAIRNEMERILREKHHIGHLTVQFEYGECDNKNIINGK